MADKLIKLKMATSKTPKRRGARQSSDGRSPAESPGQATSTARQAPSTARQAPRVWYRSTLFVALVSSTLLYAAFPPMNLWPLAWLAPVGWLMLIQQGNMPGRRPYVALWSAGLAFWLAMLFGISLAHPALIVGWIALSAYLACYLPLFVGLSRVAVHRLRLPLTLAAPVVWVGLELARGYMVTGFSAALLGHSQVAWNQLIQVADLGGGYTVSFLMMLISASAVSALFPPAGGATRPLARAAGPGLALALLGLTLFYGRHPTPATTSDQPELKVALIQNSIDTIFEYNPERNVQSFEQYLDKTLEACSQHPDLDLVIWPESAFTGDFPRLTRRQQVQPPANSELDAQEFEERLNEMMQAYDERLRNIARAVNAFGAPATPQQTWLVVGTETRLFGPQAPGRFNTALLISPQGQIRGQYDKIHRVLFGEYLPLGDFLPWIYDLTPMSEGLMAGDQARVFELKGNRLAPSICFENTVPQLIRWQCTELQRQQTPPGLLVNVTNDGWFWGSSILDLHLTCGVFRAVENRKPMLIAANTGISAVIDARGRIVRRAGKRTGETLLARVRSNESVTMYQRVGDLPALVCLAACILLAATGLWGRGAQRSASAE